MESSFFKDKAVETHLELAEPIFLVRAAKPKQTVLTHFYPRWNDINFFAETAEFNAFHKILQSEDGLELDIV